MSGRTDTDHLRWPDWKLAIRCAPEHEIRDSVHRRLMWESNTVRHAIWRIRKQDIGHMPAPVLVERWRPSIFWRLTRTARGILRGA